MTNHLVSVESALVNAALSTGGHRLRLEVSARRLRHLLEAQRLTVSDAAWLCGCNAATIVCWLNEVSPVPAAAIRMLEYRHLLYRGERMIGVLWAEPDNDIK